jgi:hypothetical protein
LPPSAPIHQLATHDVLAGFLRASDPARDEGLVAWLPERPCGALFDGYLRPDALAILRFGQRVVALFVERDLGTESAAVLAGKIRRYRAMLARAPELAATVGFVVESDRRARTVVGAANGRAGSGGAIVAVVAGNLRADPYGVRWRDGREDMSTRELAAMEPRAGGFILMPGCIADRDALMAFGPDALVSVLGCDPAAADVT